MTRKKNAWRENITFLSRIQHCLRVILRVKGELNFKTVDFCWLNLKKKQTTLYLFGKMACK